MRDSHPRCASGAQPIHAGPDGPLTVDDDRRNREVGGDIPGEFNPAEKESSEAFGSLSERRNDEADRGGEQRPRNKPRMRCTAFRIELPIVDRRRSCVRGLRRSLRRRRCDNPRAEGAE